MRDNTTAQQRANATERAQHFNEQTRQQIGQRSAPAIDRSELNRSYQARQYGAHRQGGGTRARR